MSNWHAVPTEGRVSYCEECAAPLGWTSIGGKRQPLDLFDVRGFKGAWEAQLHAGKCSNPGRWKGQSVEDFCAGNSQAVAEANSGPQEAPGADFLF